MEGLRIALWIELGNRFCPEAIFKFIFAAGIPLVLSLQLKDDARTIQVLAFDSPAG
jgi:hypothetical protein